MPPFVAGQVGWSFAQHPEAPRGRGGTYYVDEAMRTWYAGMGLPLMAYSSQGGGFFGAENVEWARGGFEGSAPRAGKYDSSANRERLLRAVSFAESRGCTPNQVALGYLMSQSFLAIPIIGTSNPDHVREAMQAGTVRLSADECAELSG